MMASLEGEPETFHGQADPLVQRLYEAGKYDDVERLAVSALRGCTYSAQCIQNMQATRMKAFLAQGKKQQALESAKVLYNVAKFGRTTEAVKEIAECLKKAHPQGETAARDFRLYQQWAAQLPQATPTTRPAGLPHNPLDAIEVDPTPFTEYYSRVGGDNSPFGLARQAVLLLLMDRTTEAEEASRKAWEAALSQDRVLAAEDYARAMRATDGGTGRALAWLATLDR